jgi:hypothetical protein
MDKAIDTKVDTEVEIVKCIAFLHNIIIDIEGLHNFSSNDCAIVANGGTHFNTTRTHNWRRAVIVIITLCNQMNSVLHICT